MMVIMMSNPKPIASVVVCSGGDFELSDLAMKVLHNLGFPGRYLTLMGDELAPGGTNINRSHPVLLAIVQALGPDAVKGGAHLDIVSIPTDSGSYWLVQNRDGPTHESVFSQAPRREEMDIEFTGSEKEVSPVPLVDPEPFSSRVPMIKQAAVAAKFKDILATGRVSELEPSFLNKRGSP